MEDERPPLDTIFCHIDDGTTYWLAGGIKITLPEGMNLRYAKIRAHAGTRFYSDAFLESEYNNPEGA